ncbi:DoxX family protein [Sphingomonas canadensis]|uniref:DoxX family protein n=1 Tax=Sphingomonas canadensis TaxID=1219257 RepID=A0ABW3HFP0_9SPHN|nr:DoxX family protein [Sphingomonas canadensis]MCW3838147.1 DoxX family protein [Sphingomonas canadensis]
MAAIGRLLIASLFLYTGIEKILMPAAVQAYIGAAGIPFPWLAHSGAIAMEIIGGLMLIFGIRLAIVAPLLSAFCVVTALLFHSNFADHDQLIHFMKNIALAGGVLQVAAFAKVVSAKEPAVRRTALA